MIFTTTLKFITGKLIKKKQDIKCEECNKTFKFRGTLINHINGEHNNVRFNCEICGKKFKRKEQLKGHIQNIHG